MMMTMTLLVMVALLLMMVAPANLWPLVGSRPDGRTAALFCTGGIYLYKSPQLDK